MKRQPVIWAGLRIFGSICNALPHETAVRLGGYIGGVVERRSIKRAAKTRDRVRRILGVSETEAARIVSESYSHFGRSLVEFMRLPKMASRLDELVTVRGEENMRQALDLGKGVIFLSAHIGCWEYGASLLARRGFPMNAIGAEQRDPRITAEIERLRKCGGVNPVGKGMDLRAAIECLKKKEILAILFDQDVRESGVISPFLGFPASTSSGPIRLVQKYGSPVVPVHVVRNPDGVTMTMTLEPALSGRGGEPFGLDMQYAVDSCNEAISRWIRKTPGQWMWMYPRWATTLGDR